MTEPVAAFRRRIPPGSIAFTLLLGALGALPPLSIDMGLSVLPILQTAFAASAGEAGLTLSLFLLGFATAQLLLGPLSDRVGRRPVLLAGLFVFTLAGIGCATATSIGALVVWRLLQGMGAAAGTVLAFAIVRDLFEGAAMRAKLSYISVTLSVAPIIAPTLGGWLLLLGGWRLIYAVLAVTGLVLVLAALFGLAETRRAPVTTAGSLLGGYGPALRNRRCLGYSLVNAFRSGGMFAYVAGSPLLFIETLHVSIQLYGLLFACTAAGIMAGASFNGWLSTRGVAESKPLVIGQMLMIATAAVLVALTLGGRPSLLLLMPLLVLNIGCSGVVAPSATHAALEPMGEYAGAASALLGFLQMAVGALGALVVAAVYPAFGPAGMMATILLFAVASLASTRFAEAGVVTEATV